MTRFFNHTFLTVTNTKKGTLTIFVATLWMVLGVATIMGGLNQIPYTFANAQVEVREEQKAALLEEELQTGKDQKESPYGITLSIDRAHYIPLSPLSDSPGNQVKMLLDYSVQNSSSLLGDKVSAVMEVYAANHTLLRTTSLPEPFAVTDSNGNIQLATTFDDATLENVMVRALLTDSQKILPLSDPIEESIGLGEVRMEGSSSEPK